MITFTCFIPQTRRAFEIPGSKSELRVVFELGEDQVAKALPLILLRGILFDMSIQVIEEEPLGETGFRVKRIGNPIETYGAISSRDSSIKINGVDGMIITMAIPALDEQILVKMLSLREKFLEVSILEEKDMLRKRTEEALKKGKANGKHKAR